MGGIATGSLLKSGSGLLTITTNNSYAGGTTISGGTVQVGNGGASGNLGSGAISNAAALVFNRGDVVTVANTISGNGSLTQAGPGQLTLTGSLPYTGPHDRQRRHAHPAEPQRLRLERHG